MHACLMSDWQGPQMELQAADKIYQLFNRIEYSTSIEYWKAMTLGLPSPFRESAKGIGLSSV